MDGGCSSRVVVALRPDGPCEDAEARRIVGARCARPYLRAPGLSGFRRPTGARSAPLQGHRTSEGTCRTTSASTRIRVLKYCGAEPQTPYAIALLKGKEST